MAWTSPRTWVANAIVTAAQLNTHLRDNLSWLYSAKHGLFGRLAALDVPTGTWTPIAWDFDVEQDPTMWAASPYPERITPPLGGIWLITLNVRWEATTATGSRAIRMQQNGVGLLDQHEITMANATQYQRLAYVARFNGSTDYLNTSAWQNSGSTQTLAAAAARGITLTWLGD